MKILLVRPNTLKTYSIPVGLTSIQACLRRDGHQVNIFDATFYAEDVKEAQKKLESLGFFKPVATDKYIEVERCNLEEEFKKQFIGFSPDIVAFSLMSNDIALSHKLSLLIKKIKPLVPILWGGIHPTVDPQGSISYDPVDMICIGEGEEAMVEMVSRIENKKDFKDVKNFWIKEDGKIFKNDVRPFLDMDKLPPPDCSGFSQMHLYRPFWGKVYRIFDVELSRGCAFSCYECINPFLKKIYKSKGSYHREKTIPKAIADLKFIKETYKPEIIKFVDEVLLPGPIAKLKEFACLYKKEINLPFVSFGRVGVLSEERIQIFKAMGCLNLSIGIESGNEYTRKNILNRHMTNEQIIKAFDICNRYRIRTMGYNLIGIPEEGRKEIFNTIEVNKKANPGLMSAALVYPFGGTPLRDYCLKKGYILENDPIVDYNSDTIIKNPKLSKKELLGLHKTFVTYTLAPKWLFPLVRLCERDNALSKWLLKMFIKIFREILFKQNEHRYDEIECQRRISQLANPPKENFDIASILFSPKRMSR